MQAFYAEKVLYQKTFSVFNCHFQFCRTQRVVKSESGQERTSLDNPFGEGPCTSRNASQDWLGKQKNKQQNNGPWP